jgi:hypothetical protein
VIQAADHIDPLIIRVLFKQFSAKGKKASRGNVVVFQDYASINVVEGPFNCNKLGWVTAHVLLLIETLDLAVPINVFGNRSASV